MGVRFLTVTQAAERLDVSVETVRRLLKAGVLKGERYSRAWLIEESACTYRRKRKPKTKKEQK